MARAWEPRNTRNTRKVGRSDVAASRTSHRPSALPATGGAGESLSGQSGVRGSVCSVWSAVQAGWSGSAGSATAGAG